MPLHHTNDLSFELPEGLRDRTHHIFTLRDDGPSEVTVVISRQPLDGDQTFATYEATLLPELERSLPKFELIKKNHIQLDEQLALLLEYRWTQQGQRLHALQAHVLHPAASGERQVLQISGTALGDFPPKWEQSFYDLLSSVRLRRGEGTTRPATR